MAVILLSIVGAAYPEGETIVRNDGYHAVTLLDLDNPLPPAWLERAGIDYLYASAPPIEPVPDGAPVIAEAQRERWEKVLALYEGTGTHVLLMGGFYIKPAEEYQAVDAFGRRHPMACFRNEGFLQDMRERIVAIVQAFSAYPAFAGFVFDDGPHVRVDCCYCQQCRDLFRLEHEARPPAFEPREPIRNFRDDDPLLLWEQFQQESWQIYLRAQAEAVRSVSSDALMLTIPSDSYFYGRFLNVAVAREESVLGHSGRLQRIERIQPRHWGMFQSFPLARLPEADERGLRPGLQPWATGAHITADSPKMLMQCEGPYAPTYGRVQYMSPAEIERMARVTLTEGSNGVCYWTPAAPLPHYPDALDALAEVYRDVEQIEKEMAQRKPVRASIGVLYSTTTEAMEQPWERETSERWRHLHAWEGLLLDGALQRALRGGHGGRAYPRAAPRTQGARVAGGRVAAQFRAVGDRARDFEGRPARAVGGGVPGGARHGRERLRPADLAQPGAPGLSSGDLRERAVAGVPHDACASPAAADRSAGAGLLRARHRPRLRA